MTIKTPKFQGTHLWDRLCWAKENLEGKQSDYRIVWEDPDAPEECSKVTVPDPNWMACAFTRWHITTCRSVLGISRR